MAGGFPSMARKTFPTAAARLLDGAVPADVHEHDLGLVAEEVVVKGRHLEPVVEGHGHHGIDLGLLQDHVPHDHDAVPGLLEGRPRGEAETRVHPHASDLHR